MTSYPLDPSNFPYEIASDLMIQQEVERESREFFYAVQEILQYYRRHIHLLVAVLTENGILIPKDED